MRIKIISRDKSKLSELKQKVKEYAPSFVFSNNPEVIICFGGDGTFLHAERLHPGIPKLIIRDKSICKRCNEGELDFLLNKLFEKNYVVVEQKKLEAVIKGKRVLLASNDLVIRNADQHHAIRFYLMFDKDVFSEVIGDGVVICTAFGSTGYFHSITRYDFKEGVGLAFNNVTEKKDFLLAENPIIKFKLLRNKAYLTSDNNSKKIILRDDDEIIIRQSSDSFKIIQI